MPFLAVSLLVAFGIATFNRNKVYISELALWQDTVSKSPDKSRPFIALGLAMQKAGRLDEAYKYTARALTLDSKNAYAHYNLAQILREMHEYDRAIPHYKKALELAPDDYYFLTGYGQFLMDLKDFERAYECFKQVISKNPDYPIAHTSLGALYLAAEKPAKAIEELKIGLSLAPHLYDAHYALATALEKTGDKKGTVVHYNLFLQYAPIDDRDRKKAERKLEVLRTRWNSFSRVPASSQ